MVNRPRRNPAGGQEYRDCMIAVPMAKPRESLSLPEARRIALAAQGFARVRPARAVAADVARIVRALGLVQIDSVNVLVRSHYLPLFSRLGRYPADALDHAFLKKTQQFCL